MALVSKVRVKLKKADDNEIEESNEIISDKEITDTEISNTQESDRVILSDEQNESDNLDQSHNNDAYDSHKNKKDSQEELYKYTNIDGLEATFYEKEIIFKWVLPKEALGVKIYRRENKLVDEGNLETSTLMAENAKDYWIDRQVEIDSPEHHCYHYHFKCIFQKDDGEYIFSEGINKHLHIENNKKEKCEIDNSNIVFKGNMVKFHLKNFDNRVKRVLYKVNKEKYDEIQIPEDFINNNLKVVSRENYIKNGGILLKRIPGQDLYISLVEQLELHEGWFYFSDFANTKIDNSVKTEIRYHITWKKTSSWFGKKTRNCQIVLQCKNKPPELILAYRIDKFIPLSLKDDEAMELVKFTANQKDEEYIYEIDESKFENIASDTKLRLFLQEEDKAKYELVPDNISELKVP